MVSSRAPRRHVRIRVIVRINNQEFHGLTYNISSTGLYLRIVKEELQNISLSPGDNLQITFQLPGHAESVVSNAYIVWVNPEDIDPSGHKVVGLGIELSHIDTIHQTQIENFVDTFRYSVLVATSKKEQASGIIDLLGQDYRVIIVDKARDALSILMREEISVLLMQENLPDLTGIDFLNQISEHLPHAHVVEIVLSSYKSIEELQDFVNIGQIFHYITEPFQQHELLHIVRRAVDSYAMQVENERLHAELENAILRLRQENAYLRQRVDVIEGFDSLIGNSPQLRKALSQLVQIKESDITVHIHGETGTGKEIVARALHNNSPRKNSRFLAQNCAGMTETLQQSTLFGHKKGAFTGAVHDNKGIFQEADGGTLFLDEVAELAPIVQGSLLRALQEGEIIPVGATQPEQVDVRVLSATHKNLRQEVEHGNFREDLYYRLVVMQVDLPPLRERAGDTPLLAHHFLELHSSRHGKKIKGFSKHAMKLLEAYEWPGNVRELENEIERLVVLTPHSQLIDIENFSPHIRPQTISDALASSASAPSRDSIFQSLSHLITNHDNPLDQLLEDAERHVLMSILQAVNGNQSHASRILKIPRGTLRSKLKKYSIEP